MGEPVAETWSWRELPLLRAALRETDKGRSPKFEELADETGLDADEVRRTMRTLHDAGYLDAYFAGGMTGGYVNSVSERTRRELGSWPSANSVVDGLIQALSDAAEQEPDPERKGRLRAVAEGMAGVARGVVVAEVSAILAKHVGIP